MTIIVEDGTNVPDANSYVSVAELVTYATERGIVLPSTDAEKEVLLMKAMDYIELLDKDYMGVRSYSDQELSWPRTQYETMMLGIPKELKKAQLILAVAAITVDLAPVSSGVTRSAKRQTVGPITVEYATTSGDNRPRIPQAESLLRYLFGNSLSGQLRVVRA